LLTPAALFLFPSFFPSLFYLLNIKKRITLMLRSALTSTLNKSTRLIQKPLSLSGARFYHEKVIINKQQHNDNN
jgi:hypothetical protein